MGELFAPPPPPPPPSAAPIPYKSFLAGALPKAKSKTKMDEFLKGGVTSVLLIQVVCKWLRLYELYQEMIVRLKCV